VASVPTTRSNSTPSTVYHNKLGSLERDDMFAESGGGAVPMPAGSQLSFVDKVALDASANF
jgi:hypothetical protein